MYSLRYPTEKIGDPLGVLRTAIGDPLPAGLKAALRRIYQEYAHFSGAGCYIPNRESFRLAHGAALRTAYKLTYDDKALGWLRTVLQAVAGNRCPSCGGSRPVELDHHLAQSAYPEYAIFPLNLVAMCGPCNKRKSGGKSAHIEEAFIHPYLDQIPKVAFFSATVVRSNGSYNITFDFVPAAISDKLLAKRIKHQLTRIDMNKAIGPEVGELLGELALRIDDDIVGPAGGVVDQLAISTFLNKNADRIEKQHRIGFWQAIMSRALATDPSFCDGGYQDMLPKVVTR